MTHKGPPRFASPSAPLIVMTATLVAMLMAVTLARLHHIEGIPAPFAIVATLAITAGSWCLASVVAHGPRATGSPALSRLTAIRQYTAVLLVMIELISLSGVLTRMTLDESRVSVIEAMGAAALCVLGFFAVIQGVSRLPASWLTRSWGTLVLAVVAIVLMVSAAPGQAPVMPDDAGRTASPTPLLAIAVLGLLITASTWLKSFLAAYETSGQRRFDRFRQWTTAPPLAFAKQLRSAPPAWRAVVPAFVALLFFAFTRDMSISIALLFGGLAALVATNHGRADHAGVPARHRLPALFRFAGIAVVLFAALSWPVMLAGEAMGARGFGVRGALGYSEPRPVTFFYGQRIGIGPGWQFRFASRTGGGADVLVTIGRETGLFGLLLLLMAYVVTFGILVLLATRIARHTASAGLAWALIVLLLTQLGLAVATLAFPDQVALGEGPPLLAGGGVGYPAALLSVAIVIGLAWRAAYQAPAPSPAKSPSPGSGPSPSPAPALASLQNDADPGNASDDPR